MKNTWLEGPEHENPITPDSPATEMNIKRLEKALFVVKQVIGYMETGKATMDQKGTMAY